MIPKRAEIWAFTTELETIRLSAFLLFAPQVVLAVRYGGPGAGEAYATHWAWCFWGAWQSLPPFYGEAHCGSGAGSERSFAMALR
ncbi:MAG: hypothetical protein KJ622_08795 [Alphaproteobacteria bacterium]|nr:hypothetical protein [Alphaproteobacteria bacterium]